ncbi:hypothetical protein [Sandaracinobacteroides saxicola]|uniref:Uncharacterized protein n=1 Tax=Sandaracinobacteroides saxicola TaxID=2759707 RepID=A0A7G5II55_9SPHN|nr:hypothetical protein [Sandaracinobacteroides saxicola]QMW23047.1 hypothetical protein H3309_00580 [Sandaracinobacteroides saxicola]
MATFNPDVPVVQADPTVEVTVGAANPLPLGANRFRLVAVDDSGNESDPAFLDVIVQDVGRPTAVLDMVDGNGRRIDPRVAAGASFRLSGARSSDEAPGRIVEYRFTLLSRD